MTKEEFRSTLRATMNTKTYFGKFIPPPLAEKIKI
jgi:hypothetical protein